MAFFPQNPVCQTKIFFRMAPSITTINPSAASRVRAPTATPRPPSSSATPKTEGEGFRHADALASFFGSREIAPATGDENQSQREAKQEKPEIGKPGKLREHRRSTSS
jgi:hypothetical protein